MRTLALLLAIAGMAVAAEQKPARTDKPNIVVILADDLGYGDVHCLNSQRGNIPTPNIDRLASQGMKFTDAHSSSSVCTPSRYSILTGRYNWRSRLQKSILANESPPLIAANRLTLPGLLKAQGYRTAGMGKWHLGQDVPIQNDHVLLDQPIRNGPVTRGFDSFFGCDYRFFAPFLFIENDRFTGTPLYNRTKLGAKFGAGTPLKTDAFAHILPTVCDRAIATIVELAKTGKPFFIYLAPCAPHAPLAPTPAWKGKSGLGDYGDYVMETDAEIGRVLDALEKSGQADNTLVILSSDNGCSPHSGVKELEAKGHFPSAQFRGYKSDIWDGGHRIPFMVRWPGVVKPGTTCDRLVCEMDVMATCAALTGTKLPDNAGEDSVSLLPLLRGEDKSVREILVHHSIEGKFAIREGNWKLVLCPGSGGWDAPNDATARKQKLPAVQLYDMSVNEGERKNLQAEHPDIVKRLTAELEKIVADGRSTPGPKQQNDVPVDIFKKGK